MTASGQRSGRPARSAALMLLALGIAGLAPLPARATHYFMPDSKFCDQFPPNRGRSAIADGPSSQRQVHANVFGPAYSAACPSGSGLVTYLGSGDRAGIDAFIDHDASRHLNLADVPLTTQEWIQAWMDMRSPKRRGRRPTYGVHQIPLYVNVVAVGYNLPRCKIKQLNLSSSVLGLIFSGQITEWNHDLLVRDNPALESCAFPIRLIKRAEFAGSTFTFKDYLSKRNPLYGYYKQATQNQLWPSVANACPALGEEGMADCIRATQHSIGYIAYRDAKVRRIRTARLDSVASQVFQDPDQRFIPPSPQGCTQAADSAVVLPPVKSVTVGPYETIPVSQTVGDWSTVSITDAPAGYPMCSFSYALQFTSYQTAYADEEFLPGTGRTVIDYLTTALGDRAQARLPRFDFGKLPPRVLDASRTGIEAIRFPS